MPVAAECVVKPTNRRLQLIALQHTGKLLSAKRTEALVKQCVQHNIHVETAVDLQPLVVGVQHGLLLAQQRQMVVGECKQRHLGMIALGKPFGCVHQADMSAVHAPKIAQAQHNGAIQFLSEFNLFQVYPDRRF